MNRQPKQSHQLTGALLVIATAVLAAVIVVLTNSSVVLPLTPGRRIKLEPGSVEEQRRLPGVRVSDAWPNTVTEASEPARFAITNHVVVRLPHRRSDDGIRYRLGFTVDVAGYSSRTIDAQRQIQDRLFTILHRFLTEAGIGLVPENFQPNGDGYHCFLPDSDVHTVVNHLLSTLPRLLTEDNRAHDERIRLRMATDVGTVGFGPLGLTADAVVRLSRLVDSQPIRDAVKEHDADLVALVSDTLYQDVATRFSDLAALPFQQVDVEVKNYRAPAHLLVCG